MSPKDVFLGSTIKLNVNIEPIGGVSMSQYPWNIKIYCNPSKTVTIQSTETTKVKEGSDDNNYIVLVDTTELGPGKIKCVITAYIPDAHIDKGRPEVVAIDTGIEIIRV